MATKSDPASSRPAVSSAVLILILVIVAAALRIWSLPAANEVRDWDELGYVTDGLVIWEGMSPGWEGTPAGPQAWVGWLYAASFSGWEFLHPASHRPAPSVLKPIVSIEQALFKTYEDLSTLRRLLLWISILIALITVYASYRFGEKYGGAAGGFLTGGLVAVLPLYIENSGVAKSCSDAWMLATLAVASAGILRGTARRWWPGIILGLAIGSRIDMVLAIPLVMWVLWERAEAGDKWPLWKRLLALLALTSASALLSTPFAMQGFLALMRSIMMARVIGYWGTESLRTSTLNDLAWGQGLGPVLLLMILGIVLLPSGTKFKRAVLAVYVAGIVSTMFIGHHQPIRYNGGPILVLLTGAAVLTGALFLRWRKIAMATAVLFVAFPLVQAVRGSIAMKAEYVPENSTDWVDAHVPAGTIVYVHPSFISKAVLPTEASADALWHLVANDQAWRVKFEDGFKRFSLPNGQIPRATSEDNLCRDRAVCRRWFILGGGYSERPRYDVRLVPMSATFGLQRDTLGPEFKKTGGVIIWPTRSSGRFSEAPPGLGEPYKKWVNDQGEGILMFISPDVREKLKGNVETEK